MIRKRIINASPITFGRARDLGADDGVIPLSAKDQPEVWNPKVRHHVIDGQAV